MQIIEFKCQNCKKNKVSLLKQIDLIRETFNIKKEAVFLCFECKDIKEINYENLY